MIRKFAASFLLLFALVLPYASHAEEEERLAVHINEIRVPQMIGVVQNRRGEPVAGVRVEIFRRADGHVMGNAKTDEQGRFAYPKLKNGKYNIRVHHDGYADFYHVHITPQKASPELVLKYK
jgi:5-hydroxyisourate hydrolase-like protein (transthyretin family)